MKNLFFVASILLLSASVHAQGYNRVTSCGTAAAPAGVSPGYMDAGGSVCSNIPATTYEGTITLSAATNTSLTSGNVTMAPNSGALPAAGSFGFVTFWNTGTNPGQVCLFGSATVNAGCVTIAAGASLSKNLSGDAYAPLLYSTLGTTFAFMN